MILGRLCRNWGNVPISPWDQAVSKRRQLELPIFNLVTSRLADGGLQPPPSFLQWLRDASGSWEALCDYAPDPRGQIALRSALAEFHRPQNPPKPQRLFITPGTSLGYDAIFRLLGNPGDEILIPRPTYPLFDDLATMAQLRTRSYELDFHEGRWKLSINHLETVTTYRTRLVVVIAPHSPTGAIFSADEWKALGSWATRKEIAVLVDEVFGHLGPWDSANQPAPIPRPDPKDFPVLITLQGASKLAGLPGLKLAWAVLEGNREQDLLPLEESMGHAMDTLLPVSELAQQAFLTLLTHPQSPLPKYIHWQSQEVAKRRKALAQKLSEQNFFAREPLSGLYVICRPLNQPSQIDKRLKWEQAFTMGLAREVGVLVHGGSWYGLDPGQLVLTSICASTSEPLDHMSQYMARFSFH